MDVINGILLGLITMLVHPSQSATVLQEVEHGQVATLNCLSSDENHRFQFWHLEHTNQFIGPGNKINIQKYKYEILTGTLYISAVSSSETGRYTCVCKNIADKALTSETIELVVRRDWEEVYETDHTTNVYRVTLLIVVALILAALLVIIYNLRPNRSALFRELADEESPDEEPVPTYKIETSLKTKNNPFSTPSMENIALDTELPKAINATVHVSNEGRM
uniref:Ig-like domain-containing protein n=1 Tax=Clastoptera arizonana TaxID=38151 RepID=A0A1B6CI88_9HEMI